MLLDLYQHIPEHINPIAFSIGFFSIRWYSVMWLAGIIIVYRTLSFPRKRESRTLFSLANISRIPVFIGMTERSFVIKNYSEFQKLFIYILIGILIGGRLGYVLFYDLNYFLQNPLEIFLPIQVVSHKLLVVGYFGMSYFGGLIGAILAGIIFSKKNHINFWKLADWIIPAIPAGYFFGRLGNFLNGELYGRITDMPCGMYFPADWLGQLRHPSQLYEAFFEGVVLFVLLRILSNLLENGWREYYFPGILFSAYIFSYGLFRFMLEFFREPDAQTSLILNFLTLGQVLSIAIMILAAGSFYWRKRKKMV